MVKIILLSAIFTFQDYSSLYIILNPSWAKSMDGKIRNNSEFAVRQTIDSVYVTSYSSYLDTNFKSDWTWYRNNGFSIDTIRLKVSNFPKKIIPE